MSPVTLNEYVNWEGWSPLVERMSDGSFRLHIPTLPDFEVFGASEEEVRAEYKAALRSHLMGYLAVAKFIPAAIVRIVDSRESQVANGNGTAIGQRAVASANLDTLEDAESSRGASFAGNC